MTEFEWRVIEPLLPNKLRGVPRADDRSVLNAMFWILHSGLHWRDFPERYCPYTAWYNRFRRWTKACVWEPDGRRHFHRACAFDRISGDHTPLGWIASR